MTRAEILEGSICVWVVSASSASRCIGCLSSLNKPMHPRMQELLTHYEDPKLLDPKLQSGSPFSAVCPQVDAAVEASALVN